MQKEMRKSQHRKDMKCAHKVQWSGSLVQQELTKQELNLYTPTRENTDMCRVSLGVFRNNSLQQCLSWVNTKQKETKTA